jgi:hypothetical protein
VRTHEQFHEQFREQELRAQFLGTATRLGHAFIDLYVAAVFEADLREEMGDVE